MGQKDNQLGQRIRRRRLELNLSQGELGSRLGYTDRSTIAKIESGKNDVSSDRLKEFAQALETSVAYLVGSLEDTLKTMNVDVVPLEDGNIRILDTIRGVHVDYSASKWRLIEETDDFRTVWSDLGGFAPETKNAIPVIRADRKRSFTEMFVKDEFKGAHVNAETHLRDNVITGKLIPTGTGLHVYKEEKLAPKARDERSEIQIIFDQLSPANQSKLMELGRLYLNDQRNTKETP